ncbi:MULTISPECIES: peptidoglycan-binding domain-containing protein [Nostocales]|uniref:Peptidoglycan-binding protein n=3 Tax=Nostocales TaxID=1161 RepID=A0A0C1NG40_9CYAN|nr:peptidoglycan-binding domain-containing protein [Tolypothrix bouteillei]KAF3884739.1 peptidoglycan-binding protein [Tolypothrix bouteillei VB521301]
MTDIALLMTGVLQTGQFSLLSLANQLFLQLESSVEESNQDQLSPIVSLAQITPPEFMQYDETIQVSPLEQTTENENIVNPSQTASFVELLVASENTPKVNSRRYRRRFTTKRSGYQVVTAISYDYTNQALPTLTFGNEGIAVRALQRLLSYNGYAVQVDGVFGALTEAAVKSFQNQRSIAVDGIVGQTTWLELTQ